MEPVKEAARLATRLREEGVVCRQVWTNNGVSKVVRDLKERVAVFIGENELECVVAASWRIVVTGSGCFS